MKTMNFVYGYLIHLNWDNQKLNCLQFPWTLNAWFINICYKQRCSMHCTTICVSVIQYSMCTVVYIACQTEMRMNKKVYNARCLPSTSGDHILAREPMAWTDLIFGLWVNEPYSVHNLYRVKWRSCKLRSTMIKSCKPFKYNVLKVGNFDKSYDTLGTCTTR